MKRGIVFFSILFIFINITAFAGESIDLFSGTFKDALNYAQKENKPIMITFSTVW